MEMGNLYQAGEINRLMTTARQTDLTFDLVSSRARRRGYYIVLRPLCDPVRTAAGHGHQLQRADGRSRAHILPTQEAASVPDRLRSGQATRGVSCPASTDAAPALHGSTSAACPGHSCARCSKIKGLESTSSAAATPPRKHTPSQYRQAARKAMSASLITSTAGASAAHAHHPWPPADHLCCPLLQLEGQLCRVHAPHTLLRGELSEPGCALACCCLLLVASCTFQW